MNIQYIVVYIIITIAFVAASRFAYRKWKVFRKSKADSACRSCPSKGGCTSSSNTEKSC